MIKNRQQCKAARRTLMTLKHELEALSNGHAVGERPQHRASTVAQISELEKTIELFERLQVGNSSILPPDGFHALPELLIAARIARGMTQKDLAEFLGLKMQQIQKYEADRYQSASLHRISSIADALGVNIYQAGALAGERELGNLDPSRISSFPIGEMRRRGWLYADKVSSTEHPQEMSRQLHTFFEQAHGSLPIFRRRYARTSGAPHEAALSAWEAMVMIRADAQHPVTSFRPGLADVRWLRMLVGLSRERDGVKRVRQRLAEIGVALIVEPGLPGMRIDGAALRTSRNVFVVALTLRDPRLEWFWVTLMHELSHLILHVGTGEYDSIFDEIAAPAASDLEDEADVFGRETLIPSGQWRCCKSSLYNWSRQAILDDARRLGVGPSVVVGHIRRLCGDVELPSRLSTNVDVRKQLAETPFRDSGRRGKGRIRARSSAPSLSSSTPLTRKANRNPPRRF